MGIYESGKMVKNCSADGNGVIYVKLNDGRKHQIIYKDLDKK